MSQEIQESNEKLAAEHTELKEDTENLFGYA